MDGSNFKLKKIIKNRTFIIAIVLVILAAAAITAYTFLSPKSAREVYFKAESSTFQKYSDKLKRGYKDFNAAYSPYISERNHIRREITARVDTGAPTLFNIGNTKELLDLISKCKLVISTSNDPGAGASLTAASLLLEKSPVLDATLFTEGKRSGFTVPAFTTGRYFVMNTDKLDEIYDRFDIPIRIKKLITPADLAKTIRFSDTDWDNTFSGYGSLLASQIEESDVSYGSDSANSYGSRGRAIKIRLDANKTQRLMTQLSEKAAADTTLEAMTYGNYTGLLKLLTDMGIFEIYDILDSSGTFVLNNFLRDLIVRMEESRNGSSYKAFAAELGTMNYPNGFSMEVLLDKTGNIIGRTARLDFKRKDGTGGYFEFVSESADNAADVMKNGLLTIKVSDNSVKGTLEQNLKLVTSRDTSSKNNNGKMELSFSSARDKTIEFGMDGSFEFGGSTDGMTGTENNSVKYNLGIISAGSDVKDVITGEIKNSIRKNSKTRTDNITTDIAFKFDMPSFNFTGTEVNINVKTEKQLGIEPFSLPDLTGSKISDLNTVTDEELKQVENEIYASLGSFYMSNKPLVDAISGSRK